MIALVIILALSLVVAVVVAVLFEAVVSGTDVHGDSPTVDGGWRAFG